MTKLCPSCGELFTVPAKCKRQRCCSKSCHGKWCAVRRPEASFQRMGRKGGKVSAKTRRQDRAKRWLRLVSGSQGVALALYCVGFMHGQNTLRARIAAGSGRR